jgi:hypothetical protein
MISIKCIKIVRERKIIRKTIKKFLINKVLQKVTKTYKRYRDQYKVPKVTKTSKNFQNVLNVYKRIYIVPKTFR